MSRMSQVEYIAQEFREAARARRRQAEIMTAEAVILEMNADSLSKAIEIDKTRAAKEQERPK